MKEPSNNSCYTNREDILAKTKRDLTQGLNRAAKAKGAPALRRHRGRPWFPMPEPRPWPGAALCRTATGGNRPTADCMIKRMKEESEEEAKQNKKVSELVSDE